MIFTWSQNQNGNSTSNAKIGVTERTIERAFISLKNKKS